MYIVSDQNIQKQESKGRDIYLQLHPNMSWTTNQDKFGLWDLSGNTSCTSNRIIKNSNVDMYGEVKVRNLSSTSYSTTFLEVKKYYHLMDLANLTDNGKAFYFVAFSDATAALFDLKTIDNIDQYWTKRWMKEVTLEGQTKSVEKEIYDLPLSLAVKKYKYK